MQYANPMIIVLSVALLIAVGMFAHGVSPIVYGIASSSFRKRTPERQFQHPEFGLLTSEESLWTCEVQRDGRTIRFTVDGTESVPSEIQLAHAQRLLPRFAEIERRAIEFLWSKVDEIRGTKLDFYCLDILEEPRFTLEFINPTDDWGVWRVEFVAGEPTEIGYDH